MTLPERTLPFVSDKYEVLEELGHGGMATVYRALDRRLGREVALKIIHRHLREHRDVASRFVVEARASAKLKHPGIVEVYDVSEETDAERFLVVELVRGETLRSLLARSGALPPEIGAAIVLLVTEAVQHAHEAGIIHRDIKPENILLELPKRSAGRAFRLKITDFGIAKMLDAQGVTATGQVLGSPAHMAPEQIEAGDVDARTDVFALGVLLYECLTGALPFEGKNPAQVLRKVLEGAYTPAERVRGEVGGRWSAIVDRALERDRMRRTSSARLLAAEIREELERLGFSDASRELTAYFEDPEAQKERLRQRLVKALVEQAQQAQAKQDPLRAVADLNRAAALAPADEEVQRRVLELGRRQRVRIPWAVVGWFGLAGLMAALAWSARSKETSSAPAAESVAVPGSVVSPPAPVQTTVSSPTSSPAAAVSAEPIGSAVSAGSVASHVATAPVASASGSGTAAARTRDVRFAISPMGAKLVLDGVEKSWLGQTFQLEPGPHTVDLSVPGSRCCRDKRQSVTVLALPRGATPEPQVVPLSLEILPASITLVDAPRDGQLVCSSLQLSVLAGATKSIPMADADPRSGTCEFVRGNGERRSGLVTLRAGESNAVVWPRGSAEKE